MTPKKHYHYYLCRNSSCGIKTISETVLEDQLIQKLKELEFTVEEAEGFKKAVMSFRRTAERSREGQSKALHLELSAIGTRLTDLLQKYIDQKLDDETYGKTREALLNKQIELKEAVQALENTDTKAFDELKELVKLLILPVIAYKKADIINRRRLVISMVANLELNGKYL